LAQAIQNLVHHYEFPRLTSANFAPHSFHSAAELMAKNLRLDIKRNGLAVIISIVIRQAMIDMQICSAYAHRQDANKDLARLKRGPGQFAHLEFSDVFEYESFHQSHLRYGSRVPRLLMNSPG
jgi:hypothetical protein